MRFGYTDDCKTAAEAIERAKTVRARLRGLRPPVSAPPVRAVERPTRHLEVLVAEVVAPPETIVIPATFPKMPRIIKEVCAYFHIGVMDFMSSRRTKPLPFARQITMHLAVTLTPLSLVQIGKAMDRDHTTVLHGRDLIADLLFAGDPATREAVSALVVFFETGERNFPPPQPPQPRCRRRLWDLEQDADLKRMWAALMPANEIAQTMRRSPGSIKRRLHHWQLLGKKRAAA